MLAAGEEQSQPRLVTSKSEDGTITASVRAARADRFEISFETTDPTKAQATIECAIVERETDRATLHEVALEPVPGQTGVWEGIWSIDDASLAPSLLEYRLKPTEPDEKSGSTEA